jgi:hypothetical protein
MKGQYEHYQSFLLFCLRKSITYFWGGSVSLSVIKKTEIFTINNVFCLICFGGYRHRKRHGPMDHAFSIKTLLPATVAVA